MNMATMVKNQLVPETTSPVAVALSKPAYAKMVAE
jgi:hypothetical protein